MLNVMDLELKGKVVLVTGASDGLGAATVKALAREGANVVAFARTAEKLRSVGEVVQQAGGVCLEVVGDVTRPEDLERLVAVSLERFGRLDGLVNNAGRAGAKPIVDIADSEWYADFDLKFMAAARLVKLALPHLERFGGGAIVNVLAAAAKTPGVNSMPSSVSRAAGMTLSKVLSRELGAKNIRVNAVLVGFVESNQWVQLAQTTRQDLDRVYANLVREMNIPLKRVGRAEEFADLVTFLLSARAAYITGTAINFDGGFNPVS